MTKKCKYLALCCLVLILIFVFAFSVSAQEQPAKSKANMFLVGGSYMENLLLLDYNGNTVWSLPMSDFEWEEVNDADMLTNGDIVFAARAGFGSRVYMIRPNYAKGKGYDILWSYKVPSKAENHTCQVLSDGGILVCEAYSGYVRIVELDSKGKVRLTVGGEDSPLEGWPSVSDSHSQLRQAYKTEEGTYLLASMSEQKTFEYDATGKKIGEYNAGGFTAVKDKNGNVIVAGGDSHRITCFDPSTKKVVWIINQNDLGNSIKLGFVGAIDVKENGNLVIANWGGHGGAVGDAVIEITPPTSSSNARVVKTVNSGSSTSTVQFIDHVDPDILRGKIKVEDVVEDEDIIDDEIEQSSKKDGSNGLVWWIVSAAAVIVALGAAIAVFMIIKKKAKNKV